MALALVGDVALSVFPSPLSREQHAAGVAAMREEYGQFQFSKFDLGSLGCGQYDLGPFCSVVENDVVLDIGGCYGDTMCKFWRQAGVGGEIHVFEPVEENRRSILSVLQEMGGPGNVFVVPYGAWDCSAIADIFVDSGCSSLTGGCFERECPEFEKVKLKTIDDYVAENGLRSVDFIKMDIEGAEEKALLGASETIARYRPKLAISVYHRFDDLTRIPAVILEAFPGYRFNMRHYHRGFFETVLYAVAGR
ncbi:FkbM family methyltransferase [Desulfobaculum xiamenense]|uniref:FkbM family methyltransferase n=1 Tax=Desulfobaculum xiamenense TaxID=995050 RepID=A0A846QVD0_9BACT|nr:FkbM family methyltransferase [Desulfobaculum xiamenense]NJB69074.1 FkbM family methyltransferase [Desulfobaculum xiamenense]